MNSLMPQEQTTAMPTEQLINELQSFGVRLVDPKANGVSRRGGAGPSDHTPVTVDGATVMVPIHNAPAFDSPYVADKPDALGNSQIRRDGVVLGKISFPLRPRFTICQRPTAFRIRRSPRCMDATCWQRRFCRPAFAIRAAPRPASSAPSGSRSRRDAPSSSKTPSQLAEVAKAAVELDNVKHMVMTTGTPPGGDRGAAILVESARAVKAVVDLPIQVQCEPPDS